MGVILGVLGGVALTAVLVFLWVPWYRRRHRYRSVRRDVDVNVERVARGRRWGVDSDRAGSEHEDEEEKVGAGCNCGKLEGIDGLLLPELEVSTFTWSDLQRSKRDSAKCSADAKSNREEDEEGSGWEEGIIMVGWVLRRW